jgi:serine/threonine-protein kinase
VQTIGKYHIVRVLGHGGMGTVYEAVDPHIRRKVALKTMIPELAETAELRARFLREAQAAGGLRHRNIVTVYDLGEDKGRPFIAMEFIEGTDLEKVIQQREPFSMEWKLDVLGQICEGLAYAHRAGIVHRDVKPANIRVTPEGEVKIMDFGIAHLQSSNLTKSGLVLGTVHYMSPEQIDGHKVDHRADVFSVGAIAYELFSHRKPFDGESITGVMFKIMHERADMGMLPPSDYSPGLEAIIMKALARSPDERYQSLDEMHDELAALVRETAPRILARTQAGAAAAPAAAGSGGAAVHDADTVTLESKVVGEAEMRRGRAVRWVEDGRQALTAGGLDKARECAQEALALLPEDEGARVLALDVESETLRRRVEQEMGEIRAELDEARAAGHLQRALGLCRRLLDLDPDDQELRGVESEIQASIHDKEVEQLSSQALAYAADGDVELALKIAGRIEKIAPQSPTFIELHQYLVEEGRRQRSEKLTGVAQDHLAQGELAEAHAAAEQALQEDADNAVAREIRDRAAEVLARRAPAKPEPKAEVKAEPKPEPKPEPAPKAEVKPAPKPEAKPAPKPEAKPAPKPEAKPPARTVADAAPPAILPDPVPAPVVVAPEPPAPPAAVPAIIPEPPPQPPPARPTVPAIAPEAPPAAAAPRPAPAPRAQPAPSARLDAVLSQVVTASKTPVPRPAPETTPGENGPRGGKSEVEALTSAALNHFVQNNYGKARTAVEKALALEPENKKARELLKILGALG